MHPRLQDGGHTGFLHILKDLKELVSKPEENSFT